MSQLYIITMKLEMIHVFKFKKIMMTSCTFYFMSSYIIMAEDLEFLVWGT